MFGMIWANITHLESGATTSDFENFSVLGCLFILGAAFRGLVDEPKSSTSVPTLKDQILEQDDFYLATKLFLMPKQRLNVCRE